MHRVLRGVWAKRSLQQLVLVELSGSIIRRMRFACSILAALIALPSMLAQMASPQTAAPVTVHQVFVQDQEDHPAMSTPEGIAAFEQRHRDRTQQVRELLATGQITSADQLYDAAWVLQHGVPARGHGAARL